MIQIRPLALVPTLLAGLVAAADTPKIPVVNKTDVTLKSRMDEDVKSKDLWYGKHDGTQWGAWQKHGIPFGRDAAVVWTVPEGHWRTYIQTTEVTDAQNAAPAEVKDPGLFFEFIIDRTNPAVTIQYPAPQAKLRGGHKVTVRWNVEDANLAADTIGIEYSRAGDGRFDQVAQNLPSTGSFEWLVPSDMTISGTLRVSAKDLAGNVGMVESTQLLIDSIAPSGRVIGPTISKTLANAVQLQAVDAGPAGVASVRLWVSQDNGQTWVEGPAVDAPYTGVNWTAERDGRYRFAVVAVDQAGNATPTPKGASEEQGVILVDTTKPQLILTQASGVVEAEGMKPRQNFRPGVRAAVQFEVKDVALAPTPVTVWLSTEPGKWSPIGENLAADAAFRFEIPNISTRNARLKVTAIDQAGNVGEVIATETFVIDNTVETGGIGFGD
jgi:hypothetical protein